MMKRLLALAALSAASAGVMFILKKAEKNREEKTTVTNPVHVVTREDFVKNGITVDVPEKAVNTFWLTIDGQPTVYSLDFFLDQNEYNLRLKKSDKLEDISGMYYTWTEEATVTDGGARAVIQTVDGEAGICLWYRDGYTAALSMRGEVTPEKLDNMFHVLNQSLVLG
ncbi:MAG: hypothetical protein IJ091_10570 [Oscillospiraceae bacterium]|nr:hypothetical protein [Oscillospiraceae bacterium]